MQMRTIESRRCTCIREHLAQTQVLLNHLRQNNAADFRGKRVLELGAGVGHLAWGLYELGAHVTASNTPLGGDLRELELCVAQWLHEESEGRVPEARQHVSQVHSQNFCGTAELLWSVMAMIRCVS
jgi:2-polyprenyl-3-methyl-5-hydroxy-6-metoxy-1,4-benzoquinol methylase